MSLQVCPVCGWSKVTTYKGLRIHQGKRGCTPKGVRVAEPQQHTWDYAGPPKVQMDLMVDVHCSFNTEPEDYYPDQSRQVCHCGWTRMTTYRGLRIHQGKMGCTPKGIRIPKEEQYIWKYWWKNEVNYNKCPKTERVGIRKETLPEAPRMSNRRESAATAATVREEYKPSSVVPQRPSHRATKSKSGQEKLSTHPQVNRPVREHSTPANPEDGICVKKKNTKRQLLPENTFRGDMGGFWSAESSNDYAATAFRVTEEPESPGAAPDPSLQTIGMARQRLQGFSSDLQMHRGSPTTPAVRPKERDRRDRTLSQGKKPNGKQRKHPTFSLVNRSVREQPSSPPVVPPGKKDSSLLKINPEESDSYSEDEILNYLQGYKMGGELRSSNRPVKTAREASLPGQRFSAPTTQRPAVQLKDEDMEKEKVSQVNRSVREQESSPPVVLPKRKDAPSVISKRSNSGLPQELQNILGRKNKMREENNDNKPLESESKNLPVSPRINSPTTAAKTEEKKSSFTPQPENTKSGLQLNDSSAAEQMNRSVRELVSSPPVVPPKKKESPLLKRNQQLSDSEFDGKIHNYLQGNKMIVKKLRDINKPVDTVHEEIDSPTKATFTEENKSPSSPQSSFKKPSNPKAGHNLQDFSTAEQVNRSVMKHSNTPPAVPPKKDSTLFKIVKDRSMPTKITTAVARVSQREDPASSHKDAQSALSTGLKVKELMRMFSVTPIQEKVPRPKEKFREGHKLSQTSRPAQRFSAITSQKTTKEEDGEELNPEKDMTRTNTISHTAAAEASKKEDSSSLCEAAESQFSTAMTVKELAQMFSAQDAAVQPDEKHKEEDKPLQVKVLAEKILPTKAEGTADQAKEKNKEEEKLAQMFTGSPSTETKMNLAAVKPSKEEPKSSCDTTQLSRMSTSLKVKDLARMFSAAAMQETAARTKEKQREE